MILTFYSYKGGVGRSMALANLAYLLYEAGHKVLMVDWDLEAPGLERFFTTLSTNIDHPNEVLDRPGVLDLLLQYKQWMAKQPSVEDEGENELEDVDSPADPFSNEFFRSFLYDLTPNLGKTGSLLLLPAGRRSPEHFNHYAKAVRAFDWMNFYKKWEGGLYFEWLKDRFEETADFVLIDSRTGVTEMGGVCTYQMADAIVMFCAANEQNITGTLNMAVDFSRPEVKRLRGGRDLNLIIVPSRLEDGEGDQLNQFKKRFVELFEPYLPRAFRRNPETFWNLHIPYVPYFAFQEKLAVTKPIQAIAEGIVSSYEKLMGQVLQSRSMEDFPTQLQAWLEALDYEFEDYELRGEKFFEWVLKIRERRGFTRVVVRGVDGEACVKDLTGLQESLKTQQADEGWLVAVSRMSPAAREAAEAKAGRRAGVFCYTLDELIDDTADFTPYIEWLTKEVERLGLEKYYVPLASRKTERDPVTQQPLQVSVYGEESGWTRGYLQQWLDDPAKEHISVLGEFGTGKTWLTLHMAWGLLQDYLQAKKEGRKRPRLPLVVQLRNFSRALDLGNVLAGFFFSKHGIRLTQEIFDRLNRMGKLLLLFDGFDEMAAKVDKQQMANNFWELARVVVPGAKAVLTCRTEHFPDAKEAWKALRGEFPASMRQYLTPEPPQFEVLELEPLKEAQVREVLARRGATEETVARILGNSQLADLVQRPVMVEMVLEALPEIQAGKPVDLARVYLYATHQKMERDIKVGRTFTSLADKLFFLCELATEMLASGRMSLNYREFPNHLRQWFGSIVQEEKDLDHWHHDMMGQTILIRNDEGDYRPAHRSFLEFFAAYKIAAELGVLAEDFTAVARRPEAQTDTSQEAQGYTWSEYFEYQAVDGERVKGTPLLEFVPEGWETIRGRIGEARWAKAVLDLLVPMVAKTAEAVRRLQQWVLTTRGMSLTEAGWVGGNVATLLIQQQCSSLLNLDMRDCVLQGADLRGASLHGVQLAGAKLQEALITQAFGTPNAIAFSPDGKTFATGHADGTVRLWRAADGQPLQVLEGHQDSVNAIAFSPDGQTLTSGSFDQTVRLWRTADGQPLQVLAGHQDSVNAIAFSPDGQILASGSSDQMVRLWRAADGQPLQVLAGHQGSVNAIAFSPDGQILASGSFDQTVRLWRTADGQPLQVLEDHQGSVNAIAFSPDGQTLASGSFDQTVRLWRAADGQPLQVLAGHQDSVNAIAFSPDGQILASGSFDKTVRLWRAADGQPLQVLAGHQDSVNAIAFSPDGQILASGSFDQTVRLWCAADGQPLQVLAGYQAFVHTVAFSPDGQILASGGFDKTVQLWRATDGQLLQVLAGHQAYVHTVAFNPDGQILASSSPDKTVRLWRAADGQPLQVLAGHQDSVNAIAFSPDGQILASGSSDQMVRLWRAADGQPLQVLAGHQDSVNAIAFSPDGQILASGSSDQMVRLWRAADGQPLQVLAGHQDSVNAIAFSPNGQILASGNFDATIRLWHTADGQLLHVLEGHQDSVNAIAFSPDGQILASGSLDKTVWLWHTADGQLLHVLEGHQDSVNAIAFSPDGQILASGSFDQTVRLWDARSGECVRVLDHQPYSGASFAGAERLTPGQKAAVRALGGEV